MKFILPIILLLSSFSAVNSSNNQKLEFNLSCELYINENLIATMDFLKDEDRVSKSSNDNTLNLYRFTDNGVAYYNVSRISGNGYFFGTSYLNDEMYAMAMFEIGIKGIGYGEFVSLFADYEMASGTLKCEKKDENLF